MYKKVIKEVIEKKTNHQELNKNEIKEIVNWYSEDLITEKEMSVFLRSLLPNNLTDREIIQFFDSTFEISKMIEFKNNKNFKLDKHSTGGVGDKISLILLPILAALEIDIFKFSGGRLGHTGGTIEKLQSFENIDLNFSIKKFIEKAKTENFLISHTNDEICPFETKLYKLRTKCGTTKITGLIINSIMIKKILLANDGLLLDVKIGKGSLFQSLKEAEKFGKLAFQIAKKYQRKISVVFTNMDQRLGKTIGNKLEVIEALEALKNNYDKNLMNLIFFLGYQSLKLKQPEITEVETKKMMLEVIENKKAYQIFKNFIINCGGNFDKLENNPQIKTKYKIEIKAWKDGYLKFFNLNILGNYINQINLINDKVDYNVGLKWIENEDHYFQKGETIAILYTNKRDDSINDVFRNTLEISKNKPENLNNKVIKVLNSF